MYAAQPSYQAGAPEQPQQGIAAPRFEYKMGLFKISGSPIKFAKNPDLAVAKAEGAFDGDNHLAAGMRLNYVQSGFASPFGYLLEGVAAQTMQSFAATASGAVRDKVSPFYISAPYESQAVDIAMIDSSTIDVNPEWVARNPGWNPGNIDKGIVSLKTGLSAVQADHPVIEIINRTNVAAGHPPLNPSQTIEGMYLVPDDAVLVAKDMCKSGMTDVLGMRNLNELKIRAVPAFAAPDAEVAALYKGLKESKISNVGMNKDHVDAFLSLSTEQLASPYLTLEGLPSTQRSPAAKLSYLAEDKNIYMKVAIATRII